MTLEIAAIDLCLPQRLDERSHRRRGLEELPDHAAGLRLLEVAADPQHQRRVARDLWLPSDDGGHEHEASGRDHDGGDDESRARYRRRA